MAYFKNIIIVILLAICIKAQETDYFSELKGITSKSGETYLFYRINQIGNSSGHFWSNKHIYIYNTTTKTQNKLIEDYYSGYNTEFKYIRDYNIINNDLDSVVYAGNAGFGDASLPLVSIYDKEKLLPYNGLSGLINKIIQIPNKQEEFIAYDRLRNTYYKTTNSGDEWNYLTNDILSSNQLIGINKYDPNIYYFIDAENKLCISNDTGKTITQKVTLKNHFVDEILYYDTDEKTIYIQVKDSEKFYLFKTEDKGFTWELAQESEIIMYVTLNEIKSGEVYFTLKNMVYYSDDYLKTSNLVAEIDEDIKGIYYNGKDETLYMITNTDLIKIKNNQKEVLKTLTNINIIKELPLDYKLSQNYPNPFNPSTTIEFELPEEGKVCLMVYNVLGQLVTELVNKEYLAGRHKVIFNANNLPSGIYIYRIITEKYRETKKMLLVK